MLVPAYWSTARIGVLWGKLHNDGPMPDVDFPSRFVYVPAENRLQLVDLSTRTVKTVFEAPGRIEAVGALFADKRAQRIAATKKIRTAQQIFLLGEQCQVIETFNVPENDRTDSALWYELGDGNSVAVFSNWYSDDDVNREQMSVYRISRDGAIASKTELLLEHGSAKWHKDSDAVIFRCALPTIALLAFIEPLMIVGNDYGESYTSASKSMWRNSWRALVGVVLVSAVLAAGAWRRAQAFCLPRQEQIAWVLFVLLLGFPGYVGYLLHRRWPVREECPHCRGRVPWDRPACARCGKPFPSAPAKGIEVFC
jgi:hypothetical protein